MPEKSRIDQIHRIHISMSVNIDSRFDYLSTIFIVIAVQRLCQLGFLWFRALLAVHAKLSR